MTRQMIRGQKERIDAFTSSLQLEIETQIRFAGAGEIDTACFGVDENNQLTDDRYFIFYNQLSSPEGAICKLAATDPTRAHFSLDLAKLPAHVTRLAFTATLDGTGMMSQLTNGYFRVLAGQQELLRFDFTGADFAAEKAIILAEVYLRDVWRIAAVGQGFNGGLNALLAYYGGEEAQPPAPGSATPSPEDALRAIMQRFQKSTFDNTSPDKGRNQVLLSH